MEEPSSTSRRRSDDGASKMCQRGLSSGQQGLRNAWADPKVLIGRATIMEFEAPWRAGNRHLCQFQILLIAYIVGLGTSIFAPCLFCTL